MKSKKTSKGWVESRDEPDPTRPKPRSLFHSSATVLPSAISFRFINWRRKTRHKNPNKMVVNFKVVTCYFFFSLLQNLKSSRLARKLRFLRCVPKRNEENWILTKFFFKDVLIVIYPVSVNISVFKANQRCFRKLPVYLLYALNSNSKKNMGA